MSLHEDINFRLSRVHEDIADCVLATPSSLAFAVLREYSSATLEPHLEYASLEHLKHMARRFLARRHEHEGEENPVFQGEMFSGHLQDRYPIPRKQGEEPVYKLRSHLTADERAWNVKMLRKKAEGFLLHADALEAEAQAEIESAAA